ncbi:MAG TPA: hypothetical protein VGF63_04220, partial [Solirubrobacteraceae bacterium]
MSALPSHEAEERWRRTVEQRGRPLKLKVGRLLREFGHRRLEPGVGDSIEARLARVGLRVTPPLRDVTADQVITLDLVRTDVPRPAPRAGGAFPIAPSPGAPGAPAPGARPGARVDGASVGGAPGAAVDAEQTPLVWAAVEAERHVRDALDQAAAMAAERIAALERDLAAEREAAAAAREERDAVARRVAAERRAAAARLEQLSASERGALRELDGGARPFELDDDLPQVRLAYEPSATGSDDGLDPAQVRHPYQPAAARRADGFLEPGFALEPDDDLA